MLKKKDIRHIYDSYSQLRKMKRVNELRPDSKPKALNLNIIDSCNSKCTMCNIWKNEESVDITPEELGLILSDPLYSELQHVGVTGGEPTLREDLPDIYRTIIDTLPSLKGVSMITNAIEERDVKNRITAIYDICKSRNMSFSVMVSIDGVGSAHDRVRGIKNNFSSAIAIFEFCRTTLGIPTTFGCTISKQNVWEVDDFLYYAKKHDMYGRFRVAEFINRLYNGDRDKVIRNFDEDETYNLLLFFEKLKRHYEPGSTIKRTYRSIQNMLQGGERLIGCPYHNDGVVLGSKGQVNYCAPKGNDIGNALETSSQVLYKNNFAQKEAIAERDCKNCIHDYHAGITYAEKQTQLTELTHHRLLDIDNIHLIKWLAKTLKTPYKSKPYQVFIFGWYGTETVGDKAILGGIVDEYTKLHGDNIEFVLGSLYPFVTKRTCKELKINAKVVSTKSLDVLRYSKSADEVVMGGGPLMDLHELYIPLLGFKVAKDNGKKTVVYGCGLGPLHEDKYEKAVKQILALSSDIKLRDRKSVATANAWGFEKASLSGDFAKPYIERHFLKQSIKSNTPFIACFLREWTYEYSRELTLEEFEVHKKAFEAGIARLIKEKVKELGVNTVLLDHMHNFDVGYDDRDFSRYFIDTYFADEPDIDISFNKRLSTVASVVHTMQSASFNICMRFHSVLFAHTLETDFCAIDYTKGGKITNYLTDNDELKRMYSPQELAR